MNNRDIITSLIQIDETSKSSICHTIKDGIRRCNGVLQKGAFMLGAYLIAAKAHSVWRIDGSEAKSFHHWCEWELGYKRSMVKYLMRITTELYPLIVNRLTVRPELQEIPPTNLIKLLPYLKGKTEDQKYELLDMALNDSARGLEGNLKNERGKIAFDQCDHKGVEMFYIEWCRDCNSTLSKKKVET